MKKTRLYFIVSLSVLSTLLGVLLILNLSIGDKQIDQRITRAYSVEDPQFLRTMSLILGHSLVPGNKIEELINGEKIFSAMLSEIRGAEKTITFETYIFFSGSIGKEFANALSERAEHGVKVHVMLDWIGGKLEDRLLAKMEKSGVVLRRYNTPHWSNLHKLNNRTHRKIMVVDGKIGFTGGVGIADEWRGNAQDPDHWRDTHFKMEGPVVGQLQAAFIDNWMQASGNVLHGIDYLPELPHAGAQSAQVFTSSPEGGAESMQLMYLLSITAATKTIRLSASYFVPDDVAITTLVAALRRGVKVQIIVPGKYIDWKSIRLASHSVWGPLLKAGAEIYEYQPTMYHVKMMIVDDIWVSVGSTNFDNRSFSVNDEANLNIYDLAFAKRQTKVFKNDLNNARRYTLQDWDSRTLQQRAIEFLASLFSSQL